MKVTLSLVFFAGISLFGAGCKPDDDSGGSGGGSSASSSSSSASSSGSSASSGSTTGTGGAGGSGTGGTGGTIAGTGGSGGAGGATAGTGGAGGMGGGAGGMGGGAGGMGGAGGGGIGPLICDASMDDSFEENDTASQATPIMLSGATSVDFYYTYAITSAIHCGDDEDWYFYKTNVGLGPTGRFDIRALVSPNGICSSDSPDCGTPLLPASPDNTIMVEVFDATTLMTIGGATNDRGKAFYSVVGSPLGGDILLRVRGPLNKAWGYKLNVILRGDLYEDECEC